MNQELINLANDSAQEILEAIQSNAMSEPGAVCAILYPNEFSIKWVSASNSVRADHIAFGGCATREDILARIKEEDNY